MKVIGAETRLLGKKKSLILHTCCRQAYFKRLHNLLPCARAASELCSIPVTASSFLDIFPLLKISSHYASTLYIVFQMLQVGTKLFHKCRDLIDFLTLRDSEHFPLKKEESGVYTGAWVEFVLESCSTSSRQRQGSECLTNPPSRSVHFLWTNEILMVCRGD